MNPERWKRLSELFEQAGKLQPERWRAFLDAAAGDDRELADEVFGMLQARASSNFIEPPTVASGTTLRQESDPWIGRVLGEFELLAEIGQGGMGSVVFRARQQSLGREVAVKVLLPSPLVHARHIARFEQEARAVARLHHPNVVAIHAVGRAGELLYFAMELVDGPDLAKELLNLAGGDATPTVRLPRYDSPDYVTTVVQIVEQAADALAYAHENHVVHRDIKPHNLLLDPHGNVRVVDFGLARDESQGSITETGEQAGTPHYMSPEQVRASLHAVDARTDVYSLGVVLFELLTLRRPYDGATRNEIYDSIKHADAPHLRKLAPRVPRDLELVCNTAMARELAERYASAAEFRDDLRRFLRHEAVVARAPSVARRVRKFVSKHRWSLAIAGAVVVALVFGFQFAEKQARERRWSDDVELFARVADPSRPAPTAAELVEARKRRLALRDAETSLPTDVARAATRLDAFLDADRARRIKAGNAALLRGKAGRRDPVHFGEYASAPSERDLADAMRTFAEARTIYWDDEEVQRSADIENTFPRISVRLAQETQASAPNANDAHAYLRPVDSVLGLVGESQDLGSLPIQDRPIPPGYWRIVIDIPSYGTAELTRYLIASVATQELVARVLPEATVHAGMKSISAGRVTFPPLPRLGCGQVGDGADFDAFWIDEAELSNREFVAYLEATRARPPTRWVELGYKGDWRALPLGEVGERWLDLPITGISTQEATACAEWYGKRLPTHIELERVLRGPDMLLEPWDGLARAEDAGRFNIDRPGIGAAIGVDACFAEYLRNVLPVRADGYRQRPENLFHTYGNVAELTESMLVEAQDGMLLTFPWTRLNLGGAWDARTSKQALTSHPYWGVGDAYTPTYIGLRCAKSARP